MLNKVQSYAILSGDTARQITSSREQWTDFLRLAGRLYKYPFGEQLLIYAQRPEAEACAEYDFWNSRMQRYVRRGSKGIALIDESGSQPRLKYVFDVADTGGRRKPYLWQYDEAKHQDVVTAWLNSCGALPLLWRRNIGGKIRRIYWGKCMAAPCPDCPKKILEPVIWRRRRSALPIRCFRVAA